MYRTNNIPKYIKYGISGIYIIYNKLTTKCYIGSSINVRKRLLNHRSYLLRNSHENKILQNSFNKYNIQNFEFDLLEKYDKEYLISMEQYWINMLNSSNRKYGYNIRSLAEGNLGTKRTKEQISRLRDIQVGLGYIDNRIKYVFDLEGNLLYKSNILSDISKYINSHIENILKCLKGERKTVNKYIISYSPLLQLKTFTILKKLNNKIYIFNTKEQIEKEFNISRQSVNRIIRNKETKHYKLIENANITI